MLPQLYDPDKATKALEDAGYAKGSDGIYAKGGKRLSFEMMTTQANPLRSNTIDVITQQLKPAGIEIKKFLNPDLFAGKEKPRSLEGGQYQIALFAWVASPFASQNQSIYRAPRATTSARTTAGPVTRRWTPCSRRSTPRPTRRR